MEAHGKIIAVLPAQGGVSQRTGNTWRSQMYVLETSEQYPKKIPFDVFGEDRINQFNIVQGEELTIHFDIDGSEWNGKWFAKIRCYNVSRGTGQQPAQAPAQSPAPAPAAAPPPQPATQQAPNNGVSPSPPPQPNNNGGNSDDSDLPFS